MDGTLVNWKLSQRAHDELQANGVDTRIILVEGAPHGFDAKAQPGDATFAAVEKDLSSSRHTCDDHPEEAYRYAEPRNIATYVSTK